MTVTRASSASRDGSPELRVAAASFVRGRTRRMAARKITKPCHNGAQQLDKTKGMREMVRGGRSCAHGEVLTGGDGGDASVFAGSLGARSGCGLGQREEGHEEY